MLEGIRTFCLPAFTLEVLGSWEMFLLGLLKMLQRVVGGGHWGKAVCVPEVTGSRMFRWPREKLQTQSGRRKETGLWRGVPAAASAGVSG